MSEDAAVVQEIVIVRRMRGGDDDGHHGGVWKIAFADFMTALMAFFLVMWLINAANEETKKSVASYFNPVKLTDTTSNPKGVNDPAYGASRKDKPVSKKQPRRISDSRKKIADIAETEDKTDDKQAEQALFKDPYSVLAEILKSADHEIPARKKAAEQSGMNVTASGLNGGEAFRDPFDPSSWREEPQTPKPAPQTPAPASSGGPVKAGKPGGEDGPATPDSRQAAEASKLKSSDEAEEKMAGREPEPKELPVGRPPAKVPPAPDPRETAAKEMAGKAQELSDAIKSELGELSRGAAPLIEVAGTGNGVTISLTDGFDFEMFSIGSARPKAQLVRVMEGIARVLDGEKGAITISGHTDARPFRSETYDNWRLSTARAHMAYYMLVRGGLTPARVERIEGRADRKLKEPSDPEAASNRRIEIVLTPMKIHQSDG